MVHISQTRYSAKISTHDSRVLVNALNDNFFVPQNRYYLADAGYTLTKSFLTPYRGTRYHLREQARAQLRPQTKEELFNLRHAALRNVVERVFGLLKMKYPILRRPSDYSVPVQNNLIFSIACLHNYIIFHGPPQSEDDERIQNEVELHDDTQHVPDNENNDDRLMNSFRTRMATEMWNQYRQVVGGPNMQ
ncbi:hypothetical protein O181_081707 [Austropuccinia psidii MF-1]|uniref:DDE Tnp4 domain-containing protein n=1 Tax=Austropuccinia psidii MF-1 TaxID=1389203 RepID=A0A9Q3IIK2_9BASI|nr:hypothetical protein [Austropuccinia psidii MF-1]